MENAQNAVEITQNAPGWLIAVVAVFMVTVFAFVIIANKKGKKQREEARESGTPVPGVVTEVRQLDLKASVKNREEERRQNNNGVGLGDLINIGQQIANSRQGRKGNLADFTSKVTFEVEYVSPFTNETRRATTSMNWQKEYYPEDLLEYSIPSYPYNTSGMTHSSRLPKSSRYPVTVYVMKHPKKDNKEIIAASFEDSLGEDDE